jgi:hypothetical protein
MASDPTERIACCFAFEPDRVVAHRGGHRDVVHELAQHVDRDSGIGVALGVAVA